MSSQESEEAWVRLDSRDMAKTKNETVRGVAVHLTVSPWDIPEKVRGFYDEKLTRFVIEFRYLGEEAGRQLPEEDHVSLVIGKSSGRLLKVLIDVESMRGKVVSVKRAIDKLSELHEQRRENYQLANSVLEGLKTRLFPQSLVGAAL